MKERIKQIRQKMNEKGLDGLIVTSQLNVYYLSGFSGTSAQLLITLNDTYLLTDFRYLEQAEQETQGFSIINRKNSYNETLKKLLPEGAVVGFEEQNITYASYEEMAKELSGLKLEKASAVFSGRQTKDQNELECVREAVKIADAAFEHILTFINVGKTEQEIALELEYYMRKKGASGPSFDFIAASGYRSSMPHGVATSKKLENNELLTLDYGAIYRSYCSDITRTVYIGKKAEEKAKEIYKIVLEAQKTGIESIKPGITGKEADSAARSIITKYGYGEYFGHGLGHSLGLEVHEDPNLNSREERILEPGMVLTVEPGIYIPGWGGIRIEDVVLVTENGAEVLTQAPKEFIIIHQE